MKLLDWLTSTFPTSVHRRGLFAWVLWIAILVNFNAPHITAATLHVSTAGTDSNSGTQSQPYRTIRKALSVVTAGDTLYLAGGTYAERIDSNSQPIPSGTSWSSTVTIAALPGETVVLRPGGGGEVINLAHSYIKYLVIDGLILDANKSTTGVVSLTNGANHVRFKNCEVKGAIGQGILTTASGTDFNEFINLNVHDNGTNPGQDHGLYISTSHNLIDGCTVHHNAGYGLHIYHGSANRVHNNVARNNKVYNNGTLGTSTNAVFGIILSSGTGNLAYNNGVWGHPSGGILIAYGSVMGAKVYNNTIFNNGGYGVDIYGDSSYADIKNNIIYQNAAGSVMNRGTGTVLTNNLTGDPKFVNASSGDFRLGTGSPAIDAGVSLSEVLFDHYRVLRPQGARYDIGACEYQSGQGQPSGPSNLRIGSQ